MGYSKRELLSISKKVKKLQKLTPQEIVLLQSFNKVDKESEILVFLKKAAVPIALIAGFFIAVFPSQIEMLTGHFPSWTNLPEPIVNGADYIWNIIGEPVGKSNVLYHLPNIVLYSFGVLGVKKLFDAIDRKTWIDRVNFAKNIVSEQISVGSISLILKKGHSVLFVGRGDFIGMQHVVNQPDGAIVIAEQKPTYTNLWNYYSPETGYDDLKTVINRVCQKNTGEYVFFPVKDDQIFLPSPSAYDLSPHKLDIVCQDIRLIEKKNKWSPKRIIIVGDRFHQSFVQSEDLRGKLKGSEDSISLLSISQKHPYITLLDPTDIVLLHILKTARGRKIVFRATKEGISEYKERFFARLSLLGYNNNPKRKGILTIGYDLFEDLTEQQKLSNKIDEYYPVVLSKVVNDALLRNGYKSNDFIYVPDLVLKELSIKTSEQ